MPAARIAKCYFEERRRKYKKDKMPGTRKYHEYYAAMRYKGVVYPVRINVDRVEGDIINDGYYYHKVYDIIIEVPNAAGTSPRFLGATAIDTSTTISISILLDGVNLKQKQGNSLSFGSVAAMLIESFNDNVKTGERVSGWRDNVQNIALLLNKSQTLFDRFGGFKRSATEVERWR